MVLVHTWDDGSISAVNLIDDSRIKSDIMKGEMPLWLKERIAVMRLCSVGSSETIGERVSPNLMYVHLNQEEYSQLTGAEDETVNDAKDS